MFDWFKKVFGTKNDREVKKLRPLVVRINEIEAGLQSLSDDDLRKKTADWKAELSKIEDNAQLAAKLTEILPEAFAVVKNACRRLCGQDVIVRLGDMHGVDPRAVGPRGEPGVEGLLLRSQPWTEGMRESGAQTGDQVKRRFREAFSQ